MTVAIPTKQEESPAGRSWLLAIVDVIDRALDCGARFRRLLGLLAMLTLVGVVLVGVLWSTQLFDLHGLAFGLVRR